MQLTFIPYTMRKMRNMKFIVIESNVCIINTKKVETWSLANINLSEN